MVRGRPPYIVSGAVHPAGHGSASQTYMKVFGPLPNPLENREYNPYTLPNLIQAILGGRW